MANSKTKKIDFKKKSDLTTYLTELCYMATVAERNFEIWWVYRNKKTGEKYKDTIDQYYQFFEMSIQAHLITLIVQLYCLYEKRDDTYSIPSLIKGLEENKEWESLNKIYNDEAKPLWLKVGILRNKVYGHRSKSLTVEQSFIEAKVTPKELQKLVKVTKKLLNEMSLAYIYQSQAFNLSSHMDTLRLLDDLNSAQQSQLMGVSRDSIANPALNKKLG